eukprot:CAMPEP_0195514696 /NCGR_PEP_ID=MMETSP0794_2-20130614/5998_1 /TAXON_ID=515487 /ORGANISM="Stephanopyxis turris, Strain CCMP 815" /LENGTH=195 /DNA_ID=CAMNT_0040642983 /DNA_START=29 /DNA_END=613 /DNA_ORIENTATION=-
MIYTNSFTFLAACVALSTINAFSPSHGGIHTAFSLKPSVAQQRSIFATRTRSFETAIRMSESDGGESPAATAVDDLSSTEDAMDAAMKDQMEKARRADELRSQEVFIKRSTGIHKCATCDTSYDESKGDVGTIGGVNPPGTTFAELPSNWRCPTCRATKDNFVEVVETVPGFEVNQGYGFGGNSLTTGQKSALIW